MYSMYTYLILFFFFFFQAEDGIRDIGVTGVQTCALPILGQLDCGQCGYLCQTYAEAIARGEEKSLSRCVPGGKATSRKLKELTESGLSNSAAAALPAAAATPLQPPPGSSDKPFAAKFRGADC